MDSLTRQLFPNFPREIAFPWRKPCPRLSDFKREVIHNNGISDIYTSVYGSNFLINKIYYDIDYIPHPQVDGRYELEDTKKIYEYCTVEKGYQVIPIVTGKKGYHLYIPVKPKLYKEKSKLYLLTAHYSIIREVFGDFKEEMLILPSGKSVRVLRNKDRIIGPDPAICGDIRRIARVPNTLRPPENINYCTYLPPDEFLDMSHEDIIVHMKDTHTYPTKINYRTAPSLTDFEYKFDKPPEFSSWTPIESSDSVRVGNPNQYLKDFLRPCLYRHMTTIHPSDDVRYASTVDLAAYTDLTPSEIISIYSSLGWEDFDEMTTKKKVIGICNDTRKGKHKPWTCAKLVKMGIPRICCVE